jgi:CHAT domain-containing protein/Tfp pilus assembly protein PilF
MIVDEINRESKRVVTAVLIVIAMLLINQDVHGQTSASNIEIERVARSLIEAKTKEEQTQIIKQHRVTVELLKEMNKQAEQLMKQSKYKEALDACELIEELSQKISSEEERGNAIRIKGGINYLQQIYDKAMEYSEESLRIGEKIGSKKLIADSLNNIGNVYTAQKHYSHALNHYQRSLKVREETNNKSSVVDSLNSIGYMYQVQGNNTQAIEYYQRSLKINEELSDENGYANSLTYIGNVYISQGNYTQALEYYQRSVKFREATGNKEGIAASLNSIGIALYYQGEYTQALEYYQRSLKISEELKDSRGTASSLSKIGLVYQRQGNYIEALKCLYNSLNISEELGNKPSIADTLTSIGLVYSNNGNYIQALECYQRSLKISEKIGYKLGICATLNNIGLVYFRHGNYKQALDWIYRGLKVSEEIQDKHRIANSLDNIGNVYSIQGDYKEALEILQKSLKIFEETRDKRGISGTLNNLGFNHYKQNNYTEALGCYLRSLEINEEIGNKEGSAASLVSISKTYNSLGKYTIALEYSTRAAQLASQINTPQHLWSSLAISGSAYVALGKPDLARKAFLDSISTIEQLRLSTSGSASTQQLFLQDKLLPYYSLISLLINKNEFSQALTYAERARARVLLDHLNSNTSDLSSYISSDELKQEERLSSDIFSINAQLSKESIKPQPDKSLLADLKGKLENARLKYETFQNDLYIAHPQLRIRKGDISIVNLDQAYSMLDISTAFLEYVVAEDATYLFVLSKSKENRPNLKVYTIKIKSKDLEKKVTDFHQIVSTRNLAVRRPAQELYSILLKPAMKELKGIKTLCIVPDGSLWNLPFQALDDGDKWMIDHFSIYYAPSLSVLHEMRKKRKSTSEGTKTELLALGNPKIQGLTMEKVRSWYRDETLSDLPNAEEEVKTLGSLYGKDKSKVLIGDAAKEEVVKGEASKYRIVHFATHGILDDKSPLYSRLMLASEDGTKEDGLLEGWEIMKMKLNADMAVLAACETARGRVSAGEGMIGMSWAMFVAGVPTTVVSQWKVDSEATSKLMVEFHKNVLAKKSRAEALRQAAIKVKNEFDIHPYYWAGFVVIGDGN